MDVACACIVRVLYRQVYEADNWRLVCQVTYICRNSVACRSRIVRRLRELDEACGICIQPLNHRLHCRERFFLDYQGGFEEYAQIIQAVLQTGLWRSCDNQRFFVWLIASRTDSMMEQIIAVQAGRGHNSSWS